MGDWGKPTSVDPASQASSQAQAPPRHVLAPEASEVPSSRSRVPSPARYGTARAESGGTSQPPRSRTPPADGLVDRQRDEARASQSPGRSARPSAGVVRLRGGCDVPPDSAHAVPYRAGD